MQEWLQEGWQDGRQQGEAALLLRQLERKFGAYPEWLKGRVTAAQIDTLEEWGMRILESASLEDVIMQRSAY